MPFPPLSEEELSDGDFTEPESTSQVDDLFQTVSERSITVDQAPLQDKPAKDELAKGGSTNNIEVKGREHEDDVILEEDFDKIQLCDLKPQISEDRSPVKDCVQETVVHFLSYPSDDENNDDVVGILKKESLVQETMGNLNDAPTDQLSVVKETMGNPNDAPVDQPAPNAVLSSSTPLKDGHSRSPPPRPVSRLSSVASQGSLTAGTFTGLARHKDGSLIPVVFQVSPLPRMHACTSEPSETTSK